MNDNTKAIFNYRLSRARRIVENAFGIMSQQFRIFFSLINLDVATTENLITCACILHNLIVDERGVPENSTELTNDEFQSIENYNETEANSAQELKFKIRDTFKEYFNTVGSVPWQNDPFRL